MSKTLFFHNKIKINTVSKELSKSFNFDYCFKFKKNVYLENQKYLIVISKHFIRVLVFNGDDIQDLEKIKKEIYNINQI